MRVVPLLRPRVGKEDVVDGDAAGRDQARDRVVRLDADQANVGEPQAHGLAIHLAHAAEHPLDAEKVGLRMRPRAREQEAPFAAAHVHLQRPRRVGKCRVEPERIQPVVGNEPYAVGIHRHGAQSAAASVSNARASRFAARRLLFSFCNSAVM